MAMLIPVVQKVGLQLLLEPQTSGVVFRAACNTVGTVYPAYQSFKAIEDTNPAGKKQDSQWLTYWVIYSAISLLEGPTDEVLAKLPYYYHAKFAFLLWLQLPNTQGAQRLYSRFLRPTLLRYQPKIDYCMERVWEVAATLYSFYKVPIEQATSLAMLGYAQVTGFLRWFTDGSDGASKGPSGTCGSASSSGSARAGSQFITS